MMKGKKSKMMHGAKEEKAEMKGGKYRGGIREEMAEMKAMKAMKGKKKGMK